MSELRDRSNRAPRTAGFARHGRLKKSAVWKTVLGLIGATLAVALVAGVSVAGIAVWQLKSSIKTVAIGADTEAAPPNIASYSGGFNILLAGSDTRVGQGGIGAGPDDGGDLNDVTMLMHVAQDQKSATVVSIPRDMVVPIPKCSKGGPASGQPINTTLSYGGLACTVLTVEALTGLQIQFAGLITFVGVIGMADAIGGVDVCVASPIHDEYTGLDIPQAGTYTMSGGLALAFLRSRHGVGDGSDLGRIGSQQVFLSSLVRKIKSNDTLTNFSKLYGIAQAATQNITLSENFTHLDTLASVALVLKNIPLENIVFVQYPGKTGGTGIYAGKVQPQTSIANALFAAIKADQPIGLDSQALEGAHGGSALGEAPAATPTPTPTPTKTKKATSSSPATAAPTATLPADPATADTPAVISGLKGQSAATYTCSVGR